MALPRQPSCLAGSKDQVVNTAIKSNRAIFLDRDGVLVVPEMRDGRSYAPRSLDDFRIYPDAAASLARLKAAGYLLVAVTNQPDIGNGLVSADTVNEMHRRMSQALPIDRIEMCPHSQSEACDCRKPKPGMLVTAASDCGIDLAESVMVGDRSSDVEAGRAAGCKTIFVDLDYVSELKPASPDFTVRSLAEAADVILGVMPNNRRAQMRGVNDLKVKIFADGADLDGILQMAKLPHIKGFTTNPTLMRKAGVTNYEAFARNLLEKITQHPVSFEVFADDFPSMIAQGRAIASWGKNVNVKVPVMNTKGEFAGPVLRALASEGVELNVTAIMTPEQVAAVAEVLDAKVPAIVSVFAGRVADTGIDPVPHMRACKDILTSKPKAELLWASPREVLNIFQADDIGCHIITCTNDMIAKLSLAGKNLVEYSRETVQMFYRDATASAFSINPAKSAA
jgi:transaldolase